MTFLYQDDIFTKLLIDTGVYGQLKKEAQQVEQAANEAKLIAKKLVTKLRDEAIETSGVGEGTESNLYVQDLTSLDAYLNFLLKNKETFENKQIVYHDAGAISGSELPPAQDAKLYVKYKEFYVYTEGLFDRLRQLEEASNKPGNEVMKPLVKNLVLTANYDSSANSNNSSGSSNSSNSKDNSNQSSNDPASNLIKRPPTATANGAEVPNVNPQKEQQDNSKESQQKAIQDLKDNLPFPDDDSLSPYKMQSFITNMSIVIGQYPQLSSFNFGIYTSTMTKYINEWNAFIGRADAAPYLEKVPYDRGNKPNTTLQTIFHTGFLAKEGAQKLLQMVILMRQALSTVAEMPLLANLLGTNMIENQINRAQNFEQSLTPFTR